MIINELIEEFGDQTDIFGLSFYEMVEIAQDYHTNDKFFDIVVELQTRSSQETSCIVLILELLDEKLTKDEFKYKYFNIKRKK